MIRLVAASTALSLALGCTITKEVDYSSGKTSSPDVAALFGSEPYVPDIETFMQIGYATSPDISRDGQQVFFTTGLTGVPQLYRLTEQGWPYQLTVFPDGIDWYTLSHSGEIAVAGVSVGGSEKQQLYLLDAQTGRVRQLTNAPGAQHGSVVWSGDDKAIFYRSNVENGRDFKLYRMDIATATPVKLLDTQGWNGWGDLSLDGKKLIYYQSVSNVDNNLYLYDIESGQGELLTPHEGEVIYDNVRFSADGKQLYLTCNDNESGINLRAVLDITDKKITYLEPDSPWNVDALVMSPERTVLAWILNEDGYARLKLADISTGQELPVPDLAGIEGGIALSGTSRMLLTFNSPTQSPEVWSWDWKSKRLEQITHSIGAGIDRALFAEPRLIRYTSFDGMEIAAFLYVPASYKGGPIPFIVDVHGGPESQFRPDFNRHFQYLLLNGFGIFAPNVRGSSGYGRKFLALDNYTLRLNSVKDMKAGVEWLIANGYTKQGMIGIKGTSYGGYMTMAAITEYPDLFSAACNTVGIVNFVSFLQQTSEYRRYLREAEYGPLSDTAFLKSISPINKADLIKTPLMVVHGENDPRVPIGEARQIITAIQKRGGVVEPLIFPDEGHGVEKLPNRLVYYRTMMSFFKKYLTSQT